MFSHDFWNFQQEANKLLVFSNVFHKVAIHLKSVKILESSSNTNVGTLPQRLNKEDTS